PLPSHFSSEIFNDVPPTHQITVFFSHHKQFTIRIRKIRDELCIAEGWTDMVQQIPITENYFLLFTIRDESYYVLEVFRPNGSNVLDISSDEEDDNEHDGYEGDEVQADPVVAQEPEGEQGVAVPDLEMLDVPSDVVDPVQPPSDVIFDAVVVVRDRFRIPMKLSNMAWFYGKMNLNVIYQDAPVEIMELRSEWSRGYTRIDDSVATGKYYDGQSFNLIKDLNVSKDNFVMKLRLLKVWRKNQYSNKNLPYSIEMIMLDEESNRIQGNCLSKWWDRFEQYLREDFVLIIRKPSLGENKGTFKYINNNIKVCLVGNTDVQLTDCWNGGVNGFQFADFQEIIDMKIEKGISIDVMGMILNSNAPVIYGSNEDGTPKRRLNFSVQDVKGRVIWINLFEEYCERLIAYVNSKPKHTKVAIILQFARFSIYKGSHSVCNAYQHSKLFLNSDCEEMNEFIKSYNQTQRDVPSSSISRLSESMSYNLEQDFLHDSEFNHIAELNLISEVKKVIILGTIKCLLEGSRWYYFSCKACNKQVERLPNPEATSTSGDLWIYKCNTSACIEEKRKIEATTKYKLLIKVQDTTGTVVLTMFDKEARRLIKVSAVDLLARYVDDGKPPVEVESIFEKRIAVKVDVSEFNIDKGYKYFTIDAVTDKSSIITELDEKHNKEQTNFSTSVTVESEGGAENESIFNKDVGADRDSTLPLAALSDKKSQTRCVSSGKVFSEDGQLKRKLNEIYDVDDGAGSSPSKEHLYDLDVGVDGNQHQLLVPKVEK
ncbi:hypothetical protein SSX86_032256, partial [Deinandra increscens subsp. villosa]